MTNPSHPGLPDYTGPTAGMFYGVHHEIPFEYSHDINERLAHIDKYKPEHERATRRRHICLMLPEDAGIPATVWAERDHLRAKAYRLLAESYRLQNEADNLQDEANHLLAEGYRLLAERDRLLAEGYRLLAESYRLLDPYRDALIAAWMRLVPDNRWDGEEIVFDSAEEPTP